MTPDPIQIPYDSPLRRLQSSRRRWRAVGWMLALGSFVMSLTAICLTSHTAPYLWANTLVPMPENRNMFIAWIGLAMCISAGVVFRAARDRGGVAICTVLAIAQAVIALILSLA